MTDVNELKADYQKVLDEYNAARKAFQERGKKVLKECFKEFFDANPKIKAVTWTQYTPFFNDGEPCTFGVHDMYALDKKGYKKWKDYGGYGEEYSVADSFFYDEMKFDSDDDFTSEERKAITLFLSSVKSLPDDLFEDMFGDHAEVTATRKGFEVEEYSHD